MRVINLHAFGHLLDAVAQLMASFGLFAVEPHAFIFEIRRLGALRSSLSVVVLA